MRYAVVIERADGNYSAYVPDLPGCVATGATVAEVEREIKEAIRFHLDGMRQDGAENHNRLRYANTWRRLEHQSFGNPAAPLPISPRPLSFAGEGKRHGDCCFLRSP